MRSSGLRYLLVGKPGLMSRLWLPLFLLRPNALLDALVRFAEPDHKIVIAFRNVTGGSA